MSYQASPEIQSLRNQLVEARHKHTEAKLRVDSLQHRVGPTSRELSEAKTRKVHLKDEVARLERVLKQKGLTEDEIQAIGTKTEAVA